LKLETLTFGTLEFDEKSIIHLPEGMLGFPKQKKYILVEEPEIQPFKWLQSLEDQYVAFPVVDPHLLFKGYLCALTLDDLRALEIEGEKDVFTLAVAVIAENPNDSSINLRAPLLINHHKMVGKQVILMDSSYSAMQPLMELTQG
jgi:flagellar assembly factor FliW